MPTQVSPSSLSPPCLSHPVSHLDYSCCNGPGKRCWWLGLGSWLPDLSLQSTPRAATRTITLNHKSGHINHLLKKSSVALHRS